MTPVTCPVNDPAIRVLSLGAGVQSTTLLLMACEGILPKLDYAIFADTGWEPASVYEHLDRLAAVAAEANIPVLKVSRGNLRDDALNHTWNSPSIPFFIRKADGTDGIMPRQCTNGYKLEPIKRKIRELLGARPPDFLRVPKGRVAEEWIGFSADEIGRVPGKDGVSYISRRYPLLELGVGGMRRNDCDRYLRLRGWTVAKSACIGCPFHGNRAWRELRDNHPDEWADAVAFDRAIRDGRTRKRPIDGEAFLHRSLMPLDEAPVDRIERKEWRAAQGDLLDVLADMEEGDPDGCSPYGCRSGSPASQAGAA